MARHLLMVERHRLAALILQDRRGREIADAERRKVRHLCAREKGGHI
jgi:hypothetical protein